MSKPKFKQYRDIDGQSHTIRIHRVRFRHIRGTRQHELYDADSGDVIAVFPDFDSNALVYNLFLRDARAMYQETKAISVFDERQGYNEWKVGDEHV